jgi:hypothetical protein
MNGKLAAALDLKSLADLPHLIRRQGAHPDRTTVRLNFIDRR